MTPPAARGPLPPEPAPGPVLQASEVPAPTGAQALIGAGVALIGVAMAWGAVGIPSAAGYAGVGPNFLPWVVAAVLALCGSLLFWQARRGGGWREVDPPSGAAQADWAAIGWVVAGIALNALLITRIGFILSCALCYVLAVRGLRLSEGKPSGGLQRWLVDAAVGAAIAAPVYWLFGRLLSINLPGLTATGWI